MLYPLKDFGDLFLASSPLLFSGPTARPTLLTQLLGKDAAVGLPVGSHGNLRES